MLCAAQLCAALGVLALAGCKYGTITDLLTEANAASTVNLLSLNGRVTAPAVSAAPVTTSIDTDQYTGTVYWRNEAGEPFTGNFEEDTVYKAVVTLKARSGYTFTGVAKDTFTYTNAAVTNAADSGTVTITFPATTNEERSGDINGEDPFAEDTAAPELSAQSVTNFTATVTGTTATVNFTSNEAGIYYVVAYFAWEAAPANGRALYAVYSSASIRANGIAAANIAVNADLTGLDKNMPYRAYLTVQDTAGNYSNLWASETFIPTQASSIPPELFSCSVSDYENTADGTTATVNLTANKGGTYYVVVYPSGAGAPADGAALEAAYNGASVKASGSVSANVAVNAAITGLTRDTAYQAYVTVKDVLGNYSGVWSSNVFIPTAARDDSPPPVLFSCSVSDYENTIDGTTAAVNFTSNKAGIYYVLVYPSVVPAPADGAAIEAAYSGASIKASGSALANFAVYAAITGLTENTAYKAYVTVKDTADNYSSVWASDAFIPTSEQAVYSISAPTHGAVNGVTPLVSFSPSSAQTAGTQITATVSFEGTATAAGTFSVNLTSVKASLLGGTQNVSVTANQTSFTSKIFIFTMPAQDVDDFILTFVFGSAPVLSWGLVDTYTNTPNGSTAMLHFTSNVTGTYWVVVFLSGTGAPASGVVVEYAYNSGIGVITKARATGGITANTIVNVSISGLVKNTAYKAYVTVKDSMGNYSSVWSSDAFTPTRITYPLSVPVYDAVNGVTPSVSFSPSSTPGEGTQVTATVSFSGTAAAPGTFSVNLNSVKASLSGSAQNFLVTANQTSFTSKTFSFTMPAQAVNDFDLTFTFDAAPVLSAGLITNLLSEDGTTATVQFTSNKTGTYYVVIYGAAINAPVDSATVEGMYNSGVNAITRARASGSAAANTAVNVNISGLVKDTAYRAHVTVKDAWGSYSIVWSSDAFIPTRITYALSAPLHGMLNGVTPSVSFSPSSTPEAGTQVTATVSFNGMAVAVGTYSVNLTSVKASLSGEVRTFTVTANQASFVNEDFSFTMPAQAVNDFVLTFTFDSVPMLSGVSVDTYTNTALGTTAAAHFISSKTGTYYMVVYPSSTAAPANGAALYAVHNLADIKASGSVTANTTVHLNITGMTKNAAYKVHVTVKDAVGNYSNVWSSETFIPTRITYTLSVPTVWNGDTIPVNGVIPCVSFSPSTALEAGTQITATVSFEGTAAAGTFSVNLTSVKAAFLGSGETFAVTGNQTSFANKTFTFTMPTQNVDDFVLTFTYVDNAAPALSAQSVTDTDTLFGTAATVNFTSDDAGTYWVVVYEAAIYAPANGAALYTAYSAVSIKATGSAAAGTAVNVNITGLTKDAPYRAHVTVKDAAGNYSNVWSSGRFTPTQVVFTLTYDYEGATGGNSAASKSVIYGSPYTLAVPTRTGHTFLGWYTGDNGTGTELTGRDGASITDWTGTTSITVHAKWIVTYSLRQTGPAGGLIFYVNMDGFECNGVTCYYLEAAPAGAFGDVAMGVDYIPFDHENPTGYTPPGSSAGVIYEWGGYGFVCGDTGTAIGDGAANTAALTTHNHQGSSYADLHPAAWVCANATIGGKDDWFLPSKDELKLMYDNLKAYGVGGFLDDQYWSSSEYVNGGYSAAWYHDFHWNYQDYESKYGIASYMKFVRGARAF